MNATPTDESEVEVSAKDGVGQYLRQAREAMELGRAEAAAGLYLNESIVIALEEDDHDALPGPVFVQGYLRKYARLLEISEEPLLKAYSRQAIPRKHQKKDKGPLAGSPIKPEIRSSHTIVRLITWAIVFGLLALVAVWWQSDMRWPMSELSGEQPAVTQETQSGLFFAPGLPEPGGEAYQSKKEPALQDSEPATMALNHGQTEAMPDKPSISALPIEINNNPLASGESASAVSGVTEIELPVARDAAVLQELELDTALGNIAESQGRPMDEAFVQPETRPAEPAPEVLVDYASSIVIEFAEACWTEIRGFNKSYKLLGNMQKGKRYVLGGKPPYTFVLGNSRAVTLTIKGQVFDLKAHTKGNIARFVLQAEDIPNS